MQEALSTRNDDPTKASRPFDKGRDGFVIAEGAVYLYLKNMSMLKREMLIYLLKFADTDSLLMLIISLHL